MVGAAKHIRLTLLKYFTWENRKPLAEAKGEVNYGSSFFEWFKKRHVYMGDVIPSSFKENRIVVITWGCAPWNFPMAMIRKCRDVPIKPMISTMAPSISTNYSNKLSPHCIT